MPVTVTNSGTETLNVTNVTAVGNFSQTNNCGSLDVAATCTVNVSFAPTIVTSPAASGGTLIVTDNAPTSPQSLSMTGPPVTSATASLSPRSLSFANQRVGTSSAGQVVTLTNILNGPATVPLTIFGVETTGAFRVTQNGCGTSLAGGSSCAITIVFAPTATGAQNGTLTISENAPVGLAIIGLSGVGQ